MRENLGAEPVKQDFFIGTTELVDLADLTNLRSMGFNRSPFPEILGKERNINPNLGSKKTYPLRGRLLPGTEKPTFVLETFE